MKTNKEISKKREIAIGEKIGGKAHFNSGALWFQKGDVSNDLIIVEDKFTRESSFSLTSTILNKIEKEGKHEGKIPIVSIGFISDNFSIGVVEDKYCKEHVAGMCFNSLQASNKSVLIKFLPIKEQWLRNEVMKPIRIYFPSLDKVFYLFEWNSLIENINSLLYL